MRPILCLLTSLLTFLTTVTAADASVTIVPLNEKDKTAQDFSFVGSLVNINNYSCGSGTVIGDGSFVLTSRHVITHDGRSDGMVLDPSNFVFILDGTGYSVEKIYANNPNDIAILKINGKYPRAIKIHASNKLVGKDFYGAGFGKSSSNPQYNKIDWNIDYGERRIFKNTIAGSISSIVIQNSTIKVETEYFFYLRDPASKLAIEGEGIFGPGDSGGGIFIDNCGQLELVGVVRALTLESPITGYFVDVYSCKEWISSIVPDAFCEEKVVLPKISSVTIRNEALTVDSCIAFIEKRRRLRVKARHEKF